MVYPFIKAGPGDIESMGVATDLSAMENMLVELDPSQDNTVKAYNGGIGYGILVNKPNALTGPSLVAKVQTRGIARWKTGPGGLRANDLVKAAYGGLAIRSKPDDGDIIYGQCVVGAAEGSIASVKWSGPQFVSIPKKD
jgi:hypothetical protein